jgi:hypothetical protein
MNGNPGFPASFPVIALWLIYSTDNQDYKKRLLGDGQKPSDPTLKTELGVSDQDWNTITQLIAQGTVLTWDVISRALAYGGGHCPADGQFAQVAALPTPNLMAQSRK